MTEQSHRPAASAFSTLSETTSFVRCTLTEESTVSACTAALSCPQLILSRDDRLILGHMYIYTTCLPRTTSRKHKIISQFVRPGCSRLPVTAVRRVSLITGRSQSSAMCTATEAQEKGLHTMAYIEIYTYTCLSVHTHLRSAAGMTCAGH